jgi:hypothetical protein
MQTIREVQSTKTDVTVHPSKASWDVAEFRSALGLSHSGFYDVLKSPKAPRSVLLGRRRLIIESPADYLARIATMEQKAQLDKALQRVAA